MTYKCKYNKEATCPILNEKLGDCEITEDSFCSEGGRKVVWRCCDYVKVEAKQ